LVPNLLVTKDKWEDEELRLKEMVGVIEAMKGLGTEVPMGGSHGIRHQLVPLGVGHRETSCIMLTTVLKYNYLRGDERVREDQKKIWMFFGGGEVSGGVVEEGFGEGEGGC
jgi:alcohol dehydrogenase class IV